MRMRPRMPTRGRRSLGIFVGITPDFYEQDSNARANVTGHRRDAANQRSCVLSGRRVSKADAGATEVQTVRLRADPTIDGLRARLEQRGRALPAADAHRHDTVARLARV